MEEGKEGTPTPEGQPESGPETATQSGSGGQVEGQPEEATAGTTDTVGTQESGEETFFDPKEIQDDPKLMAAYKQMQRAFGKKMEDIKKDRQKIEAYDAFSQDPLTQIQQMASRMGYKLTRAEAEAMQESQGTPQEPQSWDEVYQTAEERAYSRIKEELSPFLNQFQELRKTNMEKLLDDSCPDWRQYEDDMMSNLKDHPSLVNHPEKLYRLSVPPEVLESRATQRALKKLQSKAEGSKTSGVSTTTKKPKEGMPDKPMTFDEAVKFAKQRLAEDGIRSPG